MFQGPSLYQLSYSGLVTNNAKNSNTAVDLGPVMVDLLVYFRLSTVSFFKLV